ncbi:MAG: hypothetical protein R3F02_11795 [Thiolinea sp.]
MKQWVSRLLLITLVSGFPGLLQATVSEYAEFYIPYQRTQSEYVCLDRQIMQAEYGIPLASMMTGIFSPTQTLHQSSGGNTRQNINLLSSGTTGIDWQMNFDRYHPSGVYDYSFTLDMGGFNALNGSSVAGRQKTKDLAKLAIISIIKTAELTHGTGKFRVWVRFNNLPSMSGLSGVPVLAGSTDWPGWPFTSSSSLYRTYLNEMIHARC